MRIYDILDYCFKKDLNLKAELTKKNINDNNLCIKMNELLILEKKYLEERKTFKLDEKYFFNKDLCEKVKIWNRFSLQRIKCLCLLLSCIL